MLTEKELIEYAKRTYENSRYIDEVTGYEWTQEFRQSIVNGERKGYFFPRVYGLHYENKSADVIVFWPITKRKEL